MNAQEIETTGFKGQDWWPCVCGHAKCEPGQSHFFGDPRPTEPSTPWCMVSGCDCKQFRPASSATAELDPIVEERRVVGLLKPYADARHDEAIAKRKKDDAGNAIKDWLGRHPDEALYDGETGLEAVLKTRNGSESYDVGRIPEDLVLRLWKANALSIDVTMLRALANKSTLYVDCQPWRVPGKATEYLEVAKR